MALSRAEIQRRYREKKKETDKNYMQRERDRKRKSYVPVAELDNSQLKKRRLSVKKRVQKYYQRKKTQKQDNVTQEQNTPKTR